MNFIEELYYGNVDPQARGYKPGSRPKKTQASLSDLEEILTQRLEGEEKHLFLAFVNAYGECMGDATLDSFLVGFRLGARFAYDTFVSDDAPFEDFLTDKD